MGFFIASDRAGCSFPVCECAIIPVIRRLIKKGLPLHVGIVFVIASPILNPITVASTYFAFRTQPVILYTRVGLGFLLEIVIGTIIYLLFRKSNQLKRVNHDHSTILFFLLSIVQILRSCTKTQSKEMVCNCGTHHHPKGSISSNENKTEEVNTNSLKEDLFTAEGYGDYYADLARKLYQQDIIQLSDKNYLESLTVINLFLPHFVGKKIELKGFVYRGSDTKLARNQMVVARFAITCCTADASVAGILTDGSMVQKYTANTWVNIKGTIQKKDYTNNSLPMIELDHVEKIFPPKNPYVY